MVRKARGRRRERQTQDPKKASSTCSLQSSDLSPPVRRAERGLRAAAVSGRYSAGPVPPCTDILAAAQATLVLALAVFGLHRGFLVWLHLRTRRRRADGPAATPPDVELPRVTVQLPLYNEPAVAARLLRAVAALDYPRTRFDVQVLDDSSDETPATVASVLAHLPPDLSVVHIRRRDRSGFKAGALARGLALTEAELVAVFDADFVPPPDFLRRAVTPFADARIGMVQARWEHLNPMHSLLTSMQRLLLDGHFVVEHGARAATGRFFNFNGTAGVFRRACIEDAGGWQHDTLTEDLDLSYRAQLAGWRFSYRPDIACPAELPVTMSDFLGQQHRWAKGSVQTARKILPRLLRASLPLRTKIEAVFHLAGNAGFVLLLALMLVTLPLQIMRALDGGEPPAWSKRIEGLPLAASLACVLLHYGVAQATLRRCDLGTLLRLPLLLALGAGMAVNGTAALLGGLGSHTGEFLRTPKVGASPGRRPAPTRRGVLPWLEMGLGLWCTATVLASYRIGHYWTATFHGLFAAGLLWVGIGSLRDGARAPWTTRIDAQPHVEPT
ncbi:MAG: glycosyltransferase [Planctomycetota bacterium]